MNDTGVIYYATNEKYLREAEYSCKSLKRHNNLPVVLFTDERKFKSPQFNQIIYLEKNYLHPYQNKVKILQKSPFTKTIFLDTDTFIARKIISLETVFKKCDFFITKSALCDWTKTPFKLLKEEHPSEYNTGFFGYKKNGLTLKLLSLWEEEMLKLNPKDVNSYLGDQNIFNSEKIQKEFEKINYIILKNYEWNVTDYLLEYTKSSGNFIKSRIFHFHEAQRFNYKSFILQGIYSYLKTFLKKSFQ